MNLNNRYVKVGLLGLLIAVFIYLVFWAILKAIGIDDFPVVYHLTIAVLGSGYLVYQFFYDRIQ